MDGPKFPLLRAGQGMAITLAGNAIEFASTVPPLIIAKITGQFGTNTSGKIIYTWKEMIPDESGGEYIDKPNGLIGTGEANPALELNNVNIEKDTIVFLRERGVGTDSKGQVIYEFESGKGSGSAEIILITGPLIGQYYPGNIVKLVNNTWTNSDNIYVSIAGNQILVTGFYYTGIFQSNFILGETSTPIYGIAGSTLRITVVTDITCVSGTLVVTKKTYDIPGGREVP